MEPAATVARSFLLLNCQLPEVLSCARADIRLELHCYPAQRRALAITPQFYIEEYDRVGLQAGGSVCVCGGGGGRRGEVGEAGGEAGGESATVTA